MNFCLKKGKESLFEIQFPLPKKKRKKKEKTQCHKTETEPKELELSHTSIPSYIITNPIILPSYRSVPELWSLLFSFLKKPF